MTFLNVVKGAFTLIFEIPLQENFDLLTILSFTRFLYIELLFLALLSKRSAVILVLDCFTLSRVETMYVFEHKPIISCPCIQF